jgi:P27 family predicted phage terminase small subunit
VGGPGSGRRPAPTAQKKLQGVKRKDRLNENEPKVPDGPVVAPSDITEGARAVWERLAPDLHVAGVLKPADIDEFAIFCDAVDRNDQARHGLDANGMVVEEPVFNKAGDHTGSKLVVSPWWRLWKESADTVGRYGARFGLSPSDRAALKVERPDAPNEAARLLS